MHIRPSLAYGEPPAPDASFVVGRVAWVAQLENFNLEQCGTTRQLTCSDCLESKQRKHICGSCSHKGPVRRIRQQLDLTPGETLDRAGGWRLHNSTEER